MKRQTKSKIRLSGRLFGHDLYSQLRKDKYEISGLKIASY